MKILYVITKSNWGGAQRHVFDLASAMKDKGHDVWVALGGEGLLKQKLEAAGIYTFSIDTLGRDISPGKDASSFKEIYSIIKNKRPDVMHLHSPKAAGLGALAGRLLRVKNIITTIHGWSFNESRPIYERAAIAVGQWLTMLVCHTTILLSERDYGQATYFPWVKNKIKLVEPGIKAPTFISIEGAKQALGKVIGMNVIEFGKKIAIGTIAELHPNKGLSYLIEAMSPIVKQNSNIITIIIGSGQDDIMLHNKIKELNIENNVFMLGYMDNASEYLKGISLFVLPSIKEGLPYVILEAGCACLAVVATTVGGIPEVVEDMKSGILVQPKNSRELSHAISFMLEHPEERKKYGATLRERVATKYSLERMVWLIEGVYKADTRHD